MSFCSQCGAELKGLFCWRCGALQTEDALSSNPDKACSPANPYESGSQAPSNPCAVDAAAPEPDPNAPDIPNFFGALPMCFCKFASPRGRASRSEFWYYALWFSFAILLMSFFLEIVGAILFMALAFEAAQMIAPTVFWAFKISLLGVVALFVSLCFAACRRLHDSDKSGRFLWFGLLIGVAVFGVAILALQAPPSEKAAEWITLGDIGYWLIFLALLFIRLAARPTPGPNKYGPQPWKRR